ncbi:MAG: hypothetical protein ACTSSI_15585 [Candidatus Helarchaeota archaeon]
MINIQKLYSKVRESLLDVIRANPNFQEERYDLSEDLYFYHYGGNDYIFKIHKGLVKYLRCPKCNSNLRKRNSKIADHYLPFNIKMLDCPSCLKFQIFVDV